ncbi:hypothetical protein K458DRAFT_379793 [Lentithecium fluviatile CBS 122367]|uniref:Rhodopsin domain-containing protein n=1 Tax=Lentithecium fluviatile CBS 122367 TaxID=1168545 RepID=A0A6G1IF02_9PLEO|nr:hypothetical protein K458DRAFT_379793 [Lentithecium fluviatile CBS 122367]
MGSTTLPPPLPQLPPNENRGPTINIVTWICTSISTIFILLRLYSRYFITRTLGWSDAIILVAGILNVIFNAMTTVAISYGMGRHSAHIPLQNVTPALYYSTVVQPIGITAFCLPKMSVVILLISLMGTRKQGVWFLWSIIVILFITNAVASIVLFAQCDPPDHLWHPFEPADCLPPQVLDGVATLAGAWSAFTDLVLAVFPIILLRNIQVPMSKKIKIMMIMGLGFFAMIAAIIKSTQLRKNHSQDAAWDLFWLFITTAIETNIVIIAACAPTLPKLVLRLLGKDTEVPTPNVPSYSSKKLASRGYHPFDSESQPIRMYDMHVKLPTVQNERM